MDPYSILKPMIEGTTVQTHKHTYSWINQGIHLFIYFSCLTLAQELTYDSWINKKIKGPRFYCKAFLDNWSDYYSYTHTYF